jgi:hypothetical protein
VLAKPVKSRSARSSNKTMLNQFKLVYKQL